MVEGAGKGKRRECQEGEGQGRGGEVWEALCCVLTVARTATVAQCCLSPPYLLQPAGVVSGMYQR